MQDDTYNGMFIPKGTMVFANAWYVNPTPRGISGAPLTVPLQGHGDGRAGVSRPRDVQTRTLPSRASWRA